MTDFNLKISISRLNAFKDSDTNKILSVKPKAAIKIIRKLEVDFSHPKKEFLRVCDYIDYVQKQDKHVSEMGARSFLDVMIHGVTDGGNSVHTFVRNMGIDKYPEYWI